jgi:hypothetical protein
VTEPFRTGDIEEDVEIGEEVENIGRPATTSLVAVRVPQDLLARVNSYAQTHGLTLSDVLRDGAEQLVSGTVRIDAHYITGAVIYGTQLQPAPPASAAQGRLVREKRDYKPTPSYAESA